MFQLFHEPIHYRNIVNIAKQGYRAAPEVHLKKFVLEGFLIASKNMRIVQKHT